MKNNQFFVNQEGRQHITFSKRAMQIIELDMIRFNDDYDLLNKSGFINTIITNYHDQFPLSYPVVLGQVYKLQIALNSQPSTAGLSDEFIEIYTDLMMKETIAKHANKYANDVPFKLKLNKENVTILEGIEESKYFYEHAPRGAGLSFFIKVLLETYAELKKEDRERIYFWETYTDLEFANEEKYYIVYQKDNEKIKGKVISLFINEQTLNYCASIECKMSETSYRNPQLTLKELSHSKLQVTKEKYHEIIDDDRESDEKEANLECQVRFTDDGLLLYSLLENKMEIIGIPSKGDDHLITFRASEPKLFLHLFGFGPLAEIIQPEYLRNRFKELYEVSAKMYRNP